MESRGIVLLGTLCVLMLGVGSVQAADDLEQLRQENAALRQRVDVLEAGMAELKALLVGQARPTATPPAALPPTLTEEDVRKLQAFAQALPGDLKGRKPMLSSVGVDLYGYVKLDAAYDTQHLYPGNYAAWVLSEEPNDDDNEFNMTANATRLGLRFTGPDVTDAKTSGLIEFDFYGGGAENKPNPMLRHAFLKVDWPDCRLSLLAGQTWDVISPLSPDRLDYAVSWFSGNIGYRRPQVRLTKDLRLAEQTDLRLELAATRTIGDASPFFGAPVDDAGEDAGFPTVQGRLSLSLPLLTNKPTIAGLSAHHGKEEYDFDVEGHNEKYETWSINFDLTMPITPWLTFKGELFKGQDLDTYLGGINQGVDVAMDKEIESRGGWGAFTVGPFGQWTFNVGAGMDDPVNHDLSTANARTYNRAIFGNVMYSINSNTTMGFEISDLATTYKYMYDGEALRFQSSFIYKF